jgi:hypothetical protein
MSFAVDSRVAKKRLFSWHAIQPRLTQITNVRRDIGGGDDMET